MGLYGRIGSKTKTKDRGENLSLKRANISRARKEVKEAQEYYDEVDIKYNVLPKLSKEARRLYLECYSKGDK